MKARGGRFLLILGAGLAAMAFVVVYLVMSKSSSQDADPAASVPNTPVMKSIVVAKKDIPAYTTLNDSNLANMQMEESLVPADAVTDASTLYNKVSMTRLTAEKPVLNSQVSSVGFSNALAKGERAYSLPVTARNTFADAITENDRVDVLWTVGFKVSVPYYGDDGKIKYEKDVYTSTKTLLQDVKVLRVMSLRTVPPSTSGGSVNGDAQQTAANTQPQQSLSSMYAADAPYASLLVLAVNDQAAEVLKYAQDMGGHIDLTLRSSAPARDANGDLIKDAAGNELRGDHELEVTLGITLDELVKTYGLTPPPSQWLAAPVP